MDETMIRKILREEMAAAKAAPTSIQLAVVRELDGQIERGRVENKRISLFSILRIAGVDTPNNASDVAAWLSRGDSKDLIERLERPYAQPDLVYHLNDGDVAADPLIAMAFAEHTYPPFRIQNLTRAAEAIHDHVTRIKATNDEFRDGRLFSTTHYYEELPF